MFTDFNDWHTKGEQDNMLGAIAMVQWGLVEHVGTVGNRDLTLVEFCADVLGGFFRDVLWDIFNAESQVFVYNFLNAVLVLVALDSE